jgi:hypothetical protein
MPSRHGVGKIYFNLMTVSIPSSHVIGFSSEFNVQIVIRQTFETISTEIKLCVACYRTTVTVKRIPENLLQSAARHHFVCSPREFLNTLCSNIKIKHRCWERW